VKAFDTDSWVDLAAAKAAGADVLLGYLGHNLTPLISTQAVKLGMGLGAFWEGASDNPNGGAPQGIRDATTACNLADALNKWVLPILPNDQEVTDEAATLAYFQAAAATAKLLKRRVGFYGQESVWQLVKGYGYSFYVHAPDGTPGPWPEANVVQSVSPEITVGQMTCDVDEVQNPAGLWNAAGPWPKPVVTPTPPKPRKAPDMILFKDPASPAQYVAGLTAKPVHLNPTDYVAFRAAGVPEIVVDDALFAQLMAG